MKYLIDNKSEILWYQDDVSQDSDEVTSELNYWNSPEITHYIIGKENDILLGTFTRCASSFDKNNQYFGYINGKLVATVITRAGDFLNNIDKSLLNAHIINMNKGNKYVDMDYCLSTAKAKQILESKGNNNDSILYLIVNPEYQGRGYGARIVKSIKSNLDFFAPDSSHNSLSTCIHRTNNPSISVFRKNHFKKLNLCSTTILEDYYLE